MLPDTIEHCIVFMNSWDVSGVPLGASQSVVSLSHIYPLTPLVRGCASSDWSRSYQTPLVDESSWRILATGAATGEQHRPRAATQHDCVDHRPSKP